MISLKLIPIEWLDGLIVSLIALAFGLALEIAKLTHRLENVKKESLRTDSELNSLKEKHNKEISDIKELHIRESEEFRKTILEFSNQHKETPETKFFPIGSYKWKAIIFKNGTIRVDEYPLCAEHDLRFIYDNGGKQCPYIENFRKCTNRLSDSDRFRIYQSAQSIIENKIRNKMPS